MYLAWETKDALLKDAQLRLHCKGKVISLILEHYRDFHSESGDAQGSCGCPIPGGIQGQAGCGSGQPGLLVGDPAHSRRLKLNGHCGPFQPRPFYDSMTQ